MSIITISRGSYSRGKEVAEEAASRLGYECISRDLILEASEEYNLPEVKMVRAVHDAPTILERFGSDKRKYIAFFEAALLRRLQKDNVVYHGLAGHFFLKGVSHALKVRIIADFKDRVRLEVEREGASEKEAIRLLKKDDEERRKWSMSLYGIDTNDPGLYDLIVNVKNLTAKDAAEIIIHTVSLQRFQTTEISRQFLRDLAISAEARVKLINWDPEVQIFTKLGNVEVKIGGGAEQEDEIRDRTIKMVLKIDGVKHVKVMLSHPDA